MFSKNDYVVTNISPKKVYQYAEIDGETVLESNATAHPAQGFGCAIVVDKKEMRECSTHRRTHKKFITVRQSAESKNVQYVDFGSWWKTHKNSL